MAISNLQSWLNERRLTSGMSCSPVPLQDLREWQWSEGRLAHRSGAYFSIVGVSGRVASKGAVETIEQPLIYQPKTGILGSMVRQTVDGVEVLLQAKAEPGNVGGVQLAPTVQATVCNYSRVHGGLPTPFLEFFQEHGQSFARTISNSLQSEQGSRFFGKYNRNIVVEVQSEKTQELSADWGWWPFVDLQPLFLVDYAINTDLRSTLVCSDWAYLAGRSELFPGEATFVKAVRTSFYAPEAEAGAAELVSTLEAKRAELELSVEMKPLESLVAWQDVEGRYEQSPAADFAVIGYRVEAPTREIKAWDQPLVAGLVSDRMELICQKRGGVLFFLLKARTEVGYREGAQWGPSWQRLDDGDLAMDSKPLPRVEHLSSWQSDEGGRFFQSIAEYAITELPETLDFDALFPRPDYMWVTLADIYAARSRPGVFTNELRSALSLLLGIV